MVFKRWQIGCAISLISLALAIGVWGAAGGPVVAAMVEPGVDCLPAADGEGECGEAVHNAGEQTPQPTPESPCPIHVPGGVICTGPEVPPGYGPRESAFLPVMHGSTTVSQ